ncbi:conserved hypothetical protein [Hahella chejuensis KCTC 2396]|uniref:Flagellar protein FilC n=1 Tax=Hahella chejuensis (strain KCTC 2396) TaxID=349521 RepID=Q2SK29_HAHCH|nr:hypothetical protein [Hahella chejuensis]ABC28995.1 conserved hypothetical protein [Hahella chejuensis KCTC 2396]
MKHWVVSCVYCALTFTAASSVLADDEQSSVDKAREALTKQEDDADSAKQLEEVFQAAEKNYSLLKKGKMSLTYAFDYSYFGDQRLDIDIVNGSFRNFDVTPAAQHTFTNTFTFDYGVLDNLTLSTRVPLSTKYDTETELNNSDVGDVSLTARWQPFAYVPGKPSYTLFSTFKSKTGVSPYEIDVKRQLSSGSGYYSFSVGGSFSKVLDPVVIFSSVSYTFPLKETDLNQVRGGQRLVSVEPANSLSLSAGFSYALSYDVSLSVSSQLSYSDETVLTFHNGNKAVAQDQVSSLMSFAMGIRVSETKIINTSVGFGLTEDSPDVTIGVSIPINIAGLKEQ